MSLAERQYPKANNCSAQTSSQIRRNKKSCLLLLLINPMVDERRRRNCRFSKIDEVQSNVCLTFFLLRGKSWFFSRSWPPILFCLPDGERDGTPHLTPVLRAKVISPPPPHPPLHLGKDR